MRTINTISGDVRVVDARIEKASGRGQYWLLVEIEFDGQRQTLKEHSMDQRLFEIADGKENHSQIVLYEAEHRIEALVQDYISYTRRASHLY